MNDFQKATETGRKLQGQINDLLAQVTVTYVVPLMRVFGPKVQVTWELTSEYDDNNYYMATNEIAMSFITKTGEHSIYIGEYSNCDDVEEWLSNFGAFDDIENVPAEFDLHNEEHWTKLNEVLGLQLDLETMKWVGSLIALAIDASTDRYRDACAIETDILKKARLELVNGNTD